MNGRTHGEWALSYLARQWGVIPLHEWTAAAGCSCGQKDCGDAAKHPRVKWAAYQERLPSEDEVRQWWQKWPTANIGIVTGQVSRLLGVDVDGPEGYESLKRGGTLRPTPVATTGRGEHIYCQHPGVPVPSAVKFAPGLDLRCEEGYLVAPPSVHASGRQYNWRLSPERVPIAPAPEWLLKLIGLQGIRQPDPQVNADAWVTEALRGVGEGRRNQTAARLIGHYLRQGLQSDEIVSLLFLWDRNNLPSLGEEKIRQIVVSVVSTAVDRMNNRRNFNIERLVKVDTRPAIFYVTVMGVEVKLDSDDLCQFPRFQRRVFESTNTAPLFKDHLKAWIPYLNTVSSERLELILAPEEARQDAPLWHQVRLYLKGRATEEEADLAELRGPYSNETHIYFHGPTLHRFLASRNTHVPMGELWDVLRRHGVDSTRKRVKDSEGKSKVIAAWKIGKTSVALEEETDAA